ncbi:hypothetical protein [Chryseosolibacter indicus]|uniref:Uncharacterized protein n=1 Tax=Chryseosolibacter indicus TaxID=2782351 RepID=A0ABS5VNA2_9BACT|nr:hypothetical protein [Chryseosolibacter indicus]MBT1702932.1 hypothetical protein [Chryseosolibacter indicus]
MKTNKVVHQFSLFGYQRPVIRLKLGFPRERMLEAKALYEKGDFTACAAIVREFREKLEAFEERLSYGKQ